jgi:DNA (cytosine-5)-methyltransferase 1
MKYISLFSGIEAASVAWEPLGWEPVAFCEVDAFPSAVLAHRFPNVPNHGDITKVDWRNYRGSIDVVVGGSPCQSFSIAGKREGLAGESGLMFEYIRAVQEIMPRYFVWENVPGALTSESGAAFGQLLSEMDALGYGLAWRVLDAQFFGVAQRRERVFLVGCLGNAERAGEILFERESLRWDPPSSRDKRKDLAAHAERSTGVHCLQGSMIGRTDKNDPQGDGINKDISFTLNTVDRHAVVAPENRQNGAKVPPENVHVQEVYENHPQDSRVKGPLEVAPTVHAKYGTGGGNVPLVCETPKTIHQNQLGDVHVTENMTGTIIAGASVSRQQLVYHAMQVRKLTPRECERLQGFPDDWTLIPWKGKDAEQCPDGPRYKAVGNSMAVPVMRWIGERIEKEDTI